MDGFISLVRALEGSFETDFDGLPGELRLRVRQDFSPFRWEDLSPDERRAVAVQWDQQNDPALESERQRAWDMVSEISSLKRQIETWEAVPVPTASDLSTKESKLADLRRALAQAEARMRAGHRNTVPGSRPQPLRRAQDKVRSERHIAYPAALAALRGRIDAKPEELAAWILIGPEAGGLRAYLNANELDPPPVFSFPTADTWRVTESYDYLAPMMACWFQVDDIAAFVPTNRYTTGQELMARWSKVPGIDPAAYIGAKIRESRLTDIHPICGGTRAATPEDMALPPLEQGLFLVAEIEAIESEDFGPVAMPGLRPESPEERRSRIRQRAKDLRTAGVKDFLQTIATEEHLSVSRIKQLLADRKNSPKPNDPATWISPVSRRDRG